MTAPDTIPPPERPHRRHQVRITIGADDLDGVRTTLEDIALELHPGGTRVSSGGVSMGWSIEHDVDESQTPERFQRQLEAYLDALDAADDGQEKTPTDRPPR